MSGSQQLLLGGAPTVTPVDPYFYSVTSLLHGDGTNGGQNNTFLDSSSNNFTITRNGNTTQGSFSPFSQTGWGNYFDASGDYLTIASNTAFALPGDFTLEMWVYPSTITGALFGIGDYRAGNNGFSLYYFSSKLRLYVNGADVLVSASDIPLNTWLHFAVVRSGSGSNNLKLYINGTQQAQATNTVSFTGVSGNGASVNNDYGGSFAGTVPSGYLSNVRLVKGTAVYTADFTVPTTPLTAISGTSLLTCQANRFLDASSNAFAITRNGDVSVQPFSPFNPTTPYSTSSIGGSGYFDGSGDYLDASASAGLGGSGNFTLQAWIYPTTVSGDCCIYETRGGTGWVLFINSTGYLQVFDSAANLQTASTTQLRAYQWTHIALVKNGSTCTYYVNGSAAGTFTLSSFAAATRVRVGARNDAAAAYFGWITDFRTDTTNLTITVPTAPLTAGANTNYLLNYTNGAIFDNAAVADYETVGNAQISTSVKKYGTGSLAFDGTGDYLVTDAPSAQLMAFGTGDFTVEMWVYFNSVSGFPVPYDGRASGANSTTPTIYLASGTIRYYVSAADRITGPTLSASTWYHVAICRVASQTKMFINGTQVGSTYADTTVYTNTVNRPTIGGDGNAPGSNGLNGYIDDLRVSKGIGRYPYNFTPPTAEFPNIGGTVTLTADPYFDYTTLLLPGNGTNGAQNNTFLDSSTNNFTITRNGNTTQGTFSPFSQTGWGNFFDGTGDYLTTNATQAIPATGDFTIEAWVYPTVSGPGRNIVSQGTAGTSGRLQLNVHTDNTLQFAITSTIVYSSGQVAPNQWNYVAVTRTGSSVAFYINGSAAGTATLSGTVQNTTLSIGAEWSGDPYRWLGYISNVRISNVVRTITAAPTAPFTSDANTVVLTCQSNRFIDNSTNAFAITRNGDVSVQAFSPFNPTAAWSASTNGGSGYFDGSGDYLQLADSTAWDLAGDFTIEMSLYKTSTTSQTFFMLGAGGSTSILMYQNASNVIIFLTSSAVITASTAAQLNAWNHVALVRSGSTITLYLNGTNVGQATNATSFTGDAANGVRIGAEYPTGFEFTGYISNARIVKGTAVYTSAFTPPTAPLTAISGTQLLCNFTNAGIYDATSKNDLETVGNAQISTTQSKFGGSSMYFDGSGDRLTIPFTNDFLELGINGQNFTVEAWIYPTNTMASAGQMLSKGGGTASWSTSNGAQYQWGILNSAAYWSWNSSGSALQITNGNVTLNAWQHLAVTYDGTTTRTFLNGVLQATSTSPYTAPTTRNVQYIGMTQSGGFTQEYYGYIQDLRITKGIARYFSNFIPPTTAFLTL